MFILLTLIFLFLYNVVPLREDTEDKDGSSLPGTSRERECTTQHSPSLPGQSIDRNSHMLSSVIKFSFRYFEMLVTDECCFLMVVAFLFLLHYTM